jgi:hypothetical protein
MMFPGKETGMPRSPLAASALSLARRSPRRRAQLPGRRAARAAGRFTWTAGRAVLAAALATCLGSLGGCGSGGHRPVGGAATESVLHACGTARTAANVPVRVQVSRGSVACATALRVERDYATAIRDGKAPGNGGGGPVTVDGWTCRGYSTPQVLRTGKASACTEGRNRIVAVLPQPPG